MSLFSDFDLFRASDGDSRMGLRGSIRVFRRILNRCWLSKREIEQQRFFCQNSGGCGSSYVVKLLAINGLNKVFHEKTPDLNEIGVTHFDNPLPLVRLKKLIRYTRHDSWFEANNRLFSLSNAIAAAFPNAEFIHLHRHGAEAIRSAMSKPDVEKYFRDNIRFQGNLAGEKSSTLFQRCCHYWANMNQRILDDLDEITRLNGRRYLSLRFNDLISGHVESLEEFIHAKLETRKIPPVNQGNVRPAGRFPEFADWTNEQHGLFEQICGPVLQRLGYSVTL